MNLLLINSPSRKGAGGFIMPLGLLYLGSIIEKCGHQAKIIDPYLEDVSLNSFEEVILKLIDKEIDGFKPAIIGFSGIATSYGRAKQVSAYIKNKYPQIIQIAGGALSSICELLLKRANIDIVFHGETEISMPHFLKRLEESKSYHDTPGISYLKDGKIVNNPLAEQIKDLDEIPLPAYHLIDVPRFAYRTKDWAAHFRDLLDQDPRFHDIKNRIDGKDQYIPLLTSRGCTHRCSFCYRHFKGIRQHSVGYVIEHLKYFINTFGIRGFQFTDELFNSNPKWVMELCDAIDREKMDIFYMLVGARVDRMDEKMLHRLKETGCVEISYGQETGSEKIIREYRKGVTIQQNREMTGLTHEMGIISTVQIVIGSPGENNETIRETIQFMKDTSACEFSLNYLIPLPETPVWKEVEDRRLIPDVEKYLDSVAEQGGAPLVNLTYMPDKVWRRWGLIIQQELELYHAGKSGNKWQYIYKLFIYKVIAFLPFWAFRRIKPVLKHFRDLMKRK